MNILVTGASGFIGGRAMVAFKGRGWRVVGIGRRPLDRVGYRQLDLTQPIRQSLVHELGTIDVILHAAARSAPWGSRAVFQQNNVQATQHVLDLAQKIGHPKLIYVSSSSVYYEPRDQFGIDETTPRANPPINHYAASKQEAERIVAGYSGPTCILRPRAVFGRGDSVLFPRILAAALAGRLPWLVRQGEPAIGDLLAINNLTHCFLRAAEDQNIVGEFNLTDGQPVAIIPFLQDIFEQLDIPQPERRLSVKRAYRAAWMIEKFYQCCLPWSEPPITPFGVHVFAYSKTFNVSKMLASFGPLPQTVEQAVSDFVQWVKTDKPYAKRRDK
ncbi:MAG: NAD(P)-dependent oxidoreductase [Aureliella sp.]